MLRNVNPQSPEPACWPGWCLRGSMHLCRLCGGLVHGGGVYWPSSDSCMLTCQDEGLVLEFAFIFMAVLTWWVHGYCSLADCCPQASSSGYGGSRSSSAAALRSCDVAGWSTHCPSPCVLSGSCLDPTHQLLLETRSVSGLEPGVRDPIQPLPGGAHGL